MDRNRIGGHLGALVGCMGWMIGFTVVCLVSGNMDVWGRFAFAGFAISIAMGGVFIVSTELALRAFGRGSMFMLTLWGELTFFVGLLVLLLNHWIAPVLEASPRMRDTLGRMHAVYRTNDLMPTAWIAVGCVLLGIVAFRLVRTPLPPEGPPHRPPASP